MRRQVWNIIHKIKENRAIILSTHSMEEASVCCQKIGIMKRGSFVTIGTPLEICELYSKGYNLTLELLESQRNQAEIFLESILPRVTNHTRIHMKHRYQFQSSAQEMARIFEELKTHSEKYYIKSWELCTNSLRDAFYSVNSFDEAEEI